MTDLADADAMLICGNDEYFDVDPLAPTRSRRDGNFGGLYLLPRRLVDALAAEPYTPVSRLGPPEVPPHVPDAVAARGRR